MEPQDLPEASLAANVSGVAARAGFLKGISTSRVAATPACTPAAGVSSRTLAPIRRPPPPHATSRVRPWAPRSNLLSLKIIVPAFYVGAGNRVLHGRGGRGPGSIGRRIPLYLAFSLMCFPAAGFIYFSGYYHGSASLAEAAWALRWQSACGFLAVPPFFWFIVAPVYGGQARYGKWLVVVTALFLALAISSRDRLTACASPLSRWTNPCGCRAGERISLVSSTPHIVGADPVPRCDFFRVVLGAVAMCRGVPIP